MQQQAYRYRGSGVRKITSLPASSVRKGRQFLKNMNSLSFHVVLAGDVTNREVSPLFRSGHECCIVAAMDDFNVVFT
jgi:hypothetical protein